MRVLITGSAGFAGSHLVEHLLSQGHEVVAWAREGEDLQNLDRVHSRIRVVTGDLRDGGRVLEVLRDARPGRIYHLAALSSPADSLRHPRLVYDVNFTGTLNLLIAWHETGIDSRMLLVSSSQVYGTVDEANMPLTEGAPLRPATPYAGSKTAAEFAALQFFLSDGLPIVRVRPFNHTGPRQPSSLVCSDFARQVAEIGLGLRPPALTTGNLKVRRDFSDVRDVVRGYSLLLERGRPGEVYHLGSGRAVSIESILESLIGLAAKPIEVRTDPARVRPGEAPAVWGDVSKAQALGWHPEYELAATLRDLKRYWEERIKRDVRPSLTVASSVAP
ncbi:MAG TPA: GDP-mannose 4,6-dehydratase [Terriglobia bacterium]|nr:GDP-mannose 4,6-dehydratase [Terriglobia bacterium]